MMRHTVAAAILAMTLGACESRTSWIKESAAPGELEYDQLECRRAAGEFGYADRGEYGTESGRPGSTSMTAEEYRRCMERRGWRRERQTEPKTGGAPRSI
jgi:hypothetical protein